MSKKVSFTSGELSMRLDGSGMCVTVDAIEALKKAGMAYGLYHAYEDARDCRVMYVERPTPALVLEEDHSCHGSPCWVTICTLTDSPEEVKRYLAFRDVVKMMKQMEIESERKNLSSLINRGDVSSHANKKKNQRER